MRLPTRLAKLADGPPLPRRTVRLRLTLLYGGLFLVSGAMLLTITYLLVRHSTGTLLVFGGDGSPREIDPSGLELRFREPGPSLPFADEVRELTEQRRAEATSQRSEQLRQLLIQSGFALALMTVVSIGLGWLMAGRVLRPLRTMTATARRISEHNLDERLGLDGPRDELTELGDTIDDLLGRLEAAFEAQRRFVANASHELRTPLAMMRTSLDVATRKPEPATPEVEALDGKLREGLDRADRLLEDFLTLARAEHGAVGEQSAVALSEVASAAIESRGDEIAERGIDVREELDEVEVTGSRTLLSHMVENVIDNAVRHNEPSGWARVETRVDGELVRLVVESGGRRLDQGEVEELAQPFRRLGAERIGSENGLGLGLSIVAAIAAAHGGELELRARPQGGLRVLIALPRAASRQPAGEPS